MTHLSTLVTYLRAGNAAARVLLPASVLILTFVSCAQQPELVSIAPPGFFTGILHGAFAPITLLGSVFLDVRIYNYPNSGIGYDFGFIFGLAPWFANRH
jgi:hypothetical protein